MNNINNKTIIKNEYTNNNFNYFNYISLKKNKKYILNKNNIKNEKNITNENKIHDNIVTPNKKYNQHQTYNKTFKNNKIKTINNKTKKIKQFMKWNAKDYFVLKAKKIEKNNISNYKKRFSNNHKSKSSSVNNDSS